MSRRVLFNGAVLTRPGAATKLDASQFETINLEGIGIVALLGSADSGPPRSVQVFGGNNPSKSVLDMYVSGDLVEGAAMACDPSNDTHITAGAQVIVAYKVNNSTVASLVVGNLTFTTKQYGIAANNVRLNLASAADSDAGITGRIATITSIDAWGGAITETSPIVGGTPKFNIQYTGASVTVTLTISATQFTVTSSGADGFVLNFSDFASLAALIRNVAGRTNFTMTSLIANDSSFLPTDLDATAAIDIKTTSKNFYAHNFDLKTWINQNSQLITAAYTGSSPGTGPVAVTATTGLTGGTRGTSANSDWTNGYAAIGGVRVNQVVPCASVDGSSGDTYTILSILSGLESHCRYYSSTAGRSERQGFAGHDATKTALISEANLLNSEHVCYTGMGVQRFSAVTSNLKSFGAWGMACILAGMRAGAPLGEPLTWKYIKAQAVTQDASWSPTNNNGSDVSDFNLNGVICVVPIVGKGFRIERGITTYNRSDNDAYTEESIVANWKTVNYDVRTFLENRYTGRPATLAALGTVDGAVVTVMELEREAGSITDSSVNGVVTRAYRNITKALNGDQLSVGVTYSPTPGINFILNTMVIVPAQFAA